MRSARPWLLGGNASLAAALALTRATPLGDARWHDDAAYALLALATLAAWRHLRRRRLTTLLLASLAAWSLLTGLFLVYVTPAFGHGGWMRWWHGATSVGFLLAFLAHWARNHPRLATLTKRAAAAPATRAGLVGGWAVLAGTAAASWMTPLAGAFTDRAFGSLTSLSLLLAGNALLYGAIVAQVRRAAPDEAARHRRRGAVDASLLAAMWLAALTGLALLYAARPLRGLDAYWHVAGWHVVTSILLAALVGFHAAYNARPLRAHAR